MNNPEESKVKTLHNNLIFEVACLGCGKTVFNLPYIPDSYHSITCKECGEVTIVNVLENGGLAVSTLKQREEAFKIYIEDIKNYIKTVKHNYGTSTYPQYYNYTSIEKNGNIIRAVYNNYYIEIVILLRGNFAFIDNTVKGYFIENYNFSAFSNFLLVSDKFSSKKE